MTKATPPSSQPQDVAKAPGPDPLANERPVSAPHRGVIVTGENGVDSPKAFYIHIQAREGMEDRVIVMLKDIFGCVLDEPATGPWFAIRYSQTSFGIFEAFPDIAGRDAHVEGGGGDVFRDTARMNDILVRPAHVFRVDVLFAKRVFGV